MRAAAASFVQAATRSGLVMFIVAAAQSLAFVLTLQQVPHALADALIALSHESGTWLFMLLSIAILIVMGSVLEGAAALIIFGPLLVPVAARLGIAPGDMVRVSTRRGTVELAVRQDDGIPDGVVFIPFAYVEAAANLLTNPALDPFGKIPEFKYCAARVERVEAREAAE